MERLRAEDAGISAFVQLNYNYKKKYFFSGTYRNDRSSAFGDDVDAANNGGIGISWVMSNEEFFQNQNFISFLRLRASWGMTGNSRIGSYRSSGLYQITRNNFSYAFPDASPITNAPKNTDLTWEKNEKWNIGLDFNVSKATRFTLDFFKNNISDMIVGRDVPLETGYSSASINGADMYNKGVEFSAETRWFSKKDFSWTTNFNISKVINKVTSLRGYGNDFSTFNNSRSQQIGVSTSALWGYQFMGVNPATGYDQYLVNGELLEAGKFTRTPDNKSIIGNTQPDFFGGLRNSFRIKNFTLGFQISYEWGSDILIIGELIDQYRILVNRNMSVNALNYWTKPGDIVTSHIPDRFHPVTSNSSKFIHDLTNIKLQNISAGYRIPVEKHGLFRSAEIFADATNVLYWYREKSPKGLNGIREFRFMYPEMRTYSLGMRLQF